MFQPRPICNYVHKVMLQFYVCFCIFLTLMWSVAFLYLASCPSWGPVFPDGRPWERLLLTGVRYVHPA
jgi:hypothetical protein